MAVEVVAGMLLAAGQVKMELIPAALVEPPQIPVIMDIAVEAVEAMLELALTEMLMGKEDQGEPVQTLQIWTSNLRVLEQEVQVLQQILTRVVPGVAEVVTAVMAEMQYKQSIHLIHLVQAAAVDMEPEAEMGARIQPAVEAEAMEALEETRIMAMQAVAEDMARQIMERAGMAAVPEEMESSFCDTM